MSEESNDLPLEEQLERVKRKNEQLLDEAKKAKSDKAEILSELNSVKETLKKFEGVDLEKYVAIVKSQEEAEKAKALNDAKEKGEIDKLISNLNRQHIEEVEKIKSELSAQLAQREEEMNQMIVSNGIATALAKAKIQPVYMNGARALIQGRVYVAVDENGRRYAAVNVDGEAIDVEKYVGEIWVSSEEGSAYKSAPSMTGGGASGNNMGSGVVDNPFMRGKENLTKQMELYRADPKMYELLKKQAGK